MVTTVAAAEGAIGYADASQAGERGIVKVQTGSAFVGPTAADAAKLVDASPVVAGRPEHDYALELDRTAEGAYPIALVAYALACEDYADDAEAALVKEYFGYMISADGQASAAKSAGSAPLSAGMTAKLEAAVASIK